MLSFQIQFSSCVILCHISRIKHNNHWHILKRKFSHLNHLYFLVIIKLSQYVGHEIKMLFSTTLSGTPGQSTHRGGGEKDITHMNVIFIKGPYQCLLNEF